MSELYGDLDDLDDCCDGACRECTLPEDWSAFDTDLADLEGGLKNDEDEADPKL